MDDANAGGEGETLKVTAPTPLAPANGSTIDTFGPSLRITAVAAKFQGSGPITHRFQLLNGSTVLAETTTGGTSWVPSNLQNKTTYSWRARGEQGGRFGPWSATWTFTTPDQPEGYVRGNELYDPLYTGKTIGRSIGGTTFVPGLGVRLEGHGSYVKYHLQQTLEAGEFSILATNLDYNTEGGKTKIMAMIQGDNDEDITVNDRRFTVEKRGNPPGVIAWRMLTSRQQIDTVGKAERVARRFNPRQTYLWTATWGGGRLQPDDQGRRSQRQLDLLVWQGLPRGVRPLAPPRVHRWSSRARRAQQRQRAGCHHPAGVDLAETAAGLRQPVSGLRDSNSRIPPAVRIRA